MRWICLEGINGCGKSSVGRILREHLVSQGCHALTVDPLRFGDLGKLLAAHLMDANARHTPDLDVQLFGAMRLEGLMKARAHAEEVSAEVVIIERWALALQAYGVADGANASLLSAAHSALVAELTPDITFVLDVSGATAHQRLSFAGDRNRFETRGPEYLDAVAQLHLNPDFHPKPTIILNSMGPGMKTFMQAVPVLKGLLPSVWWPQTDWLDKDPETSNNLDTSIVHEF